MQKQCQVEEGETAESLKAKVQALEGIAFIQAINIFREKNGFFADPVGIVVHGSPNQPKLENLALKEMVNFVLSCGNKESDIENFYNLLVRYDGSFDDLVFAGQKNGLKCDDSKSKPVFVGENGDPATLCHYIAAVGRDDLLSVCLRRHVNPNVFASISGKGLKPAGVAKLNGYEAVEHVINNNRTSASCSLL